MPGVAAILLAAGGSVRMARRKQLLTYQGKTLIRRAAEAAVGAGCHPVVVVLGCEAERMTSEFSGLPVTPSVNERWERGIGTSIRHGVSRVIELSPTIDATLILLADQPLVSAEALGCLLDTFDRAKKPVCVSAFADAMGPPVVVDRALFPELLKLPDAHGAKALWTARPDDVATYQYEDALVDLDTPDDYARLTTGT